MKSLILNPEIRTAFRFIPSFPLHRPWFRAIANGMLRRARQPSWIEGVSITNEPLSLGSVRIYRPPGTPVGAGLMWIHGGGMMIGSPSQDDTLCARYARSLGLVVVSVDYRLAPAHPYPAAIDDCLEAWHWFVSNAENLGVDSSRIAISGQSAGGGLAACLAQRTHDAGGTQAAAVALFCAMLDDRPAARRELDALPFRVWTNRNNRAGWTAYLSQSPGAVEAPVYSVASRRTDLSGLPPSWVSVSDIDLLHDENLQYHRRLLSCGVESELYRIPQAPHGFEAMLPNSRLAHELFAANEAFLQRRLAL